MNSKAELNEVYATGQGSIRLQGCWELERDGRKNQIIISAIPYAVNKATLVERIGQLISERKLPQLLDIRDESTDIVRVVLVLKVPQGSNPEREMALAMAYICRHTELQKSYSMNMTCLVPSQDALINSKLGEDVAVPIKANLYEIYTLLKLRHARLLERFNKEEVVYQR